MVKIRRRGADDWHDDGAVDSTGRVVGTYLHGIFDNDDFRAALLARHRAAEDIGTQKTFRQRKEEGYEQLAALLREHLDLPAIYRIIEQGVL